jgi:hypothetical protein
MTRSKAFWPAAVFGGLLIGYFAIKCFKPIPPSAVRREAETEARRVANAQPQSFDIVTSVQRADLNPKEPPFQATANPWREKLSDLIDGREELFGPAGEERLKELQGFVESVAITDLPTVVREMQDFQLQKPTVFGRELQLHLLRQWAEKDVRSATDWITQMPAGNDQQEALAAAANAWAGQNFADATTWAKQLPDSAERQKALEVITDEATYDHPMETLDVAATLAPSSMLNGTIARAIAAWTRTAPEDAVSWAKQIPDQGSREQLITSIAAAWGESDPVAAGTLAVTSLRPGPLQDQAAIAVVQRWAQTDAPGVKAWIDQFPEGPLRQTAMAELDEFIKSNHLHVSQP